MSEKANQRQVLLALKARGIYHFKTMESNIRGVPDIIACYKGIFIGIEMKKIHTSKASKLQLEAIDSINESGGVASIATNVTELLALLKLADEKAEHGTTNNQNFN